MEIVIATIYTLLFIGGICSNKWMLFATPIFIFVYPKSLSLLSIGDANLSMVFLLCCGIRFIIKSKNSWTISQKSWLRYIGLYFSIICIGTQVVSLLFIPISEYYNCIKSIIDGFLCFLSVLFMFANISNSVIRDYLIKGLVVAILLESIIAIGLMHDFDDYSMFYSGKEISANNYFRATGTFNGPWALGGFLSIGIIVMLYLLQYNSQFRLRLLIIITISLSLYALVLTQSRSGWLLLAVGIVFLTIKGNRTILKGIIVFTFIGIFAASFLIDWQQFTFLLTHRIEYTYNNSITGGLDSSTLERFSIWEKIIENYNPMYLITGYGARNANNVFGSTPHNTFLSILIYSGIIGYIVIILMLKRAFLILKLKSNYTKNFFKALLIGMIAYSLSSDLLYDTRLFSLGLVAFSIMLFYDMANNKECS